jgi:hypothetical protein
MLNRWDSRVEDINLILQKLREITRRVAQYKKTRGRKPKHKLERYITLIVLKEYDKKSLRGAEVRLSELVCKERVDHSLIAYWESKEEVLLAVAKIIAIAGAMLNRFLSSLFSVIDSTKFTTWNIQEAEIFVCNRIANGVVYPVGISFKTDRVASPVDEAVPEGSGLLYADAWFDDNKAIGVLFRKGYTPVVCPNKNRWHGYYRKKARKLYNTREHRFGYRQRGRGESPFGSLTNAYGDRIKVENITAMKVRIASRIIAYQLKILVRAILNLLLIVRHALFFGFVNLKGDNLSK